MTQAAPIEPIAPPKVTILLEADLAASLRCTLAIDGKVVADGTSIELALWMVWNTCQARSTDWTEVQRQHVAKGLVELTHRIYTFEDGTEFEADWTWHTDDPSDTIAATSNRLPSSGELSEPTADR